MNYDPQPRISQKQRDTEKYVDDYIEQFGHSPTYRQVQEHFGFNSVNTAHVRLRHCREKMNAPPEYNKKDKELLVDFLNWMNIIALNEPMALETDNDDIAEMYLKKTT